ncbi:universal stress protein [Planococcus maitriensis]|uniref:Universal stress protein n=1 Tax=Planococcus maitriensis TaxID=221799 RepID=A0A365K1G8_9BACL|nr:universal stress protein [Planococcus maitriensis]RAZ66319.1 universal stress protein [Planococcus maitriensis]
MYQQILLAVDGSENSIRAAREAVKIASLVEGAEVTVVYVSDYKEDENEVIHDASAMEFDLARRKKIQPVTEMLDREKIFHHVEVLHGIPGPAIVQMTKDKQYDLLVIGSRGLSPIREVMLGSVSHKAVNHAECPVLVVR